MKILKKVLLWLLGVIMSFVIMICVAGACIYFRYGINPITVVGDARKLSENFDVDAKYDNQYSKSDLTSAKTTTDSLNPGLIKDDGSGNLYTDYGSLGTGNLLLSKDVKFSDKEIAAIIDDNMKSSGTNKIDVGGTTLNLELIQVKFLGITDEGNADVNVVLKIDISPLKTGSTIPYALKGYVPDDLYVSLTVSVTKGEDFTYSVEGKGVELNNVSEKGSANLIQLLDMVAKCGDSKKFSKDIGVQIVDAIIGTEQNKGFGYQLYDANLVKDFEFKAENDGNYIVFIKKI